MSVQVVDAEVHYAELNKPLDGRYQVVQVLSEKTWRRTYLAQDLRRPSQPECIIQHLRILPNIPDYGAIAAPLLAREAMVLERIGDHPQMPQLLAWFDDQRGFYAVSEFVQGKPLTLELQMGVFWDAEKVAHLKNWMVIRHRNKSGDSFPWSAMCTRSE